MADRVVELSNRTLLCPARPPHRLPVGLSRAVVCGIPHQVTQRGNHREPVFFGDEDRRIYLTALRDYLPRYGARLIDSCLVSNHVHFIVLPDRSDSLAKAFGRTHQDYVRWALGVGP